MKLVATTALTALLALSPLTASAQQAVKPITTTKSTQGADSLVGLGIGAPAAAAAFTVLFGLAVVAAANDDGPAGTPGT